MATSPTMTIRFFTEDAAAAVADLRTRLEEQELAVPAESLETIQDWLCQQLEARAVKAQDPYDRAQFCARLEAFAARPQVESVTLTHDTKRSRPRYRLSAKGGGAWCESAFPMSAKGLGALLALQSLEDRPEFGGVEQTG